MTQDQNQDIRLVKQVSLSNFLSFGPDVQTLTLNSLNVFIGPNGSGKSNLIEALALMRATPGDMRTVFNRGGGVNEWIWKGAPTDAARLELVIANPNGRSSLLESMLAVKLGQFPIGPMPLRHILSFRGDSQGFRLEDERVENAKPIADENDVYFFYRFQNGRPVLNIAEGSQRHLQRDEIQQDLSILAQRNDPDLYPEMSYLFGAYQKIRIYREWAFGRSSMFRQPQKADMRNDRLEEDFSNLALILSRLRRKPKAKTAIMDGLRDLYAGVDDFEVSVEGGTAQVFFTEGDYTIPATRLSDGTLRYLCLLAILCDPEPPPLICIEEPELGLHPDIIPKLADLLQDASRRTQVIVTTHSDVLVDAMTETPEAVVVCEKHEGSTSMKRLKRDDLTEWLGKYRLGKLWLEGELGGTRW
jgi:predicted ATPase